MLRSILIAALALAPALAHAGSVPTWNADLAEELTEWEMPSATDAAVSAGFALVTAWQNPAPVELALAVLADNGFHVQASAVSSWVAMGMIAPGELHMFIQVRGIDHEIAGLDGQRLLGFHYENQGAWRLVLDTASMRYGWKSGEIVSVQQDRLLKYNWDGTRFEEIKTP